MCSVATFDTFGNSFREVNQPCLTFSILKTFVIVVIANYLYLLPQISIQDIIHLRINFYLIENHIT